MRRRRTPKCSVLTGWRMPETWKGLGQNENSRMGRTRPEGIPFAWTYACDNSWQRSTTAAGATRQHKCRTVLFISPIPQIDPRKEPCKGKVGVAG